MFSSENSFGIEEASFQKLLRWRASTFFVMLFGYIGYYIVRQNFSVAIPLMIHELGYTKTQLGLIASLSEGAYAIGKLIMGPMTDKLNGRKVFLFGLLAAIVCNLLFGIYNSILWFTIVWCVCRFVLSMGWGALTKVIGHWFEPEKNGTVMGWISINFQFGGVVAGAFAGWVVARGGNWRDVFIYPALLSGIFFIYSLLASRDSPQDIVQETKFGKSPNGRKSIAAEAQITGSIEKESIFTTMRHLYSIGIFKNLLVFAFLMHFLRSVFVLWAPQLLIDIGMETKKGIFMSLGFPLLGCVGTILVGYYTDRFVKNGDRARIMWIMLVGLTLTVLAMGLLIADSTHLNSYQQKIIVVLLALTGFFLYGPYSMSGGSLALDIAGPKAVGTCTGLLDGIGYFGGTIAIYFAGIISDRFGWGYVCIALAVISAMATIACWRMSLRFQRRALLPTTKTDLGSLSPAVIGLEGQ